MTSIHHFFIAAVLSILLPSQAQARKSESPVMAELTSIMFIHNDLYDSFSAKTVKAKTPSEYQTLALEWKSTVRKKVVSTLHLIAALKMPDKLTYSLQLNHHKYLSALIAANDEFYQGHRASAKKVKTLNAQVQAALDEGRKLLKRYEASLESTVVVTESELRAGSRQPVSVVAAAPKKVAGKTSLKASSKAIMSFERNLTKLAPTDFWTSFENYNVLMNDVRSTMGKADQDPQQASLAAKTMDEQYIPRMDSIMRRALVSDSQAEIDTTLKPFFLRLIQAEKNLISTLRDYFRGRVSADQVNEASSQSEQVHKKFMSEYQTAFAKAKTASR